MEYNLTPDPNQTYYLGIDEAGRGPILGSMVYGIALCAHRDTKELNKMGFADSKQLTENKRNVLFRDIKRSDVIAWKVRILTAEEISNCMLNNAERVNLNEMSHNAAIELIRGAVECGFNVTEAFIDTVGTASTYEAKLSRLFPRIDFTVCKKADDIYPIVGAASICAKVTRDTGMENWEFIEDDITDRVTGKGYMTGGQSTDWMDRNFDPIFGYPNLVRFSWTPTQERLDKNAVNVEFDRTSKISFQNTTPTRSSYFHKNNLGVVYHDF